MKKIYEKATMTIVKFENEDIISSDASSKFDTTIFDLDGLGINGDI